jgi:hypothetical protein
VGSCAVDRAVSNRTLRCGTNDDCPKGYACLPFAGSLVCCAGDSCGEADGAAPIGPDAAATTPDAASTADAGSGGPAPDAPSGTGGFADASTSTGGAPATGGADGGGGSGGTTAPAFECPPDDALVACYTFDGDAGDQVLDGSTRKNHGTSTATHVPGVHGMGLHFASGTEAVRVPNSSSLNLVGSAATIEAWVFPAQYPTGHGLDHIVAKQSDVDTNGYAFGLYKGQFGGYSGGHGQLAGSVPVGTWSHIAAVWGPDGLALYYDGRRVGGQGRLDLAANAEVLIIGNRRPVASYPMSDFAYYGDLDVLRIYARARTPEEICADADRKMVGGSCI